MKKNFFILLLIHIIVYGKAQRLPLGVYSPIAIDSGEVNPLNIDNKIFKSHKVFNYEYGITNDTVTDAKMLLYYLKIDKEYSKKVVLVGKNDTLKEKEYWLGGIVDYINLTVFEHIPKEIQIFKGLQTIIKYDYLDRNNVSLSEELTGVIEDSSLLYLHQPRNAYFKILQLGSGLSLEYPIYVSQKKKNNLYIPLETARLHNINQAFDVKSNTEIKEIVTKEVESIGKLDCYKIQVKSQNSDLGIEAETILYFNEQYGLIEVEYYFPKNNVKIWLKLVKVEDK